ncbi:hypothetical protein VSR01_20525 [Actinacidiphila sp. DG2A-62]|uniref:hypothetical protein n=1 Tax=Actinacidiphila sp. DG2A-62 TaxID=3108821 RepID=UPI002DBCEE69|nr:hypothetical protein [Actinacidiphila sp. DG2A-62]MEC3995771.1 hypothetical protein [Actinacidiphila sp. DG2A-62]
MRRLHGYGPAAATLAAGCLLAAGAPATLASASASTSTSAPASRTPLSAVPAAAASGGDVEVHADSAPPGTRAEAAQVCVFYLDAFGFAPGRRIDWTVTARAAVPGAGAGAGTGAGAGMRPSTAAPPGSPTGPSARADAEPAPALADTITVGPDAQGVTENLALPAGAYRLAWTTPGPPAASGHRDFTVAADCPDAPAAAPAAGTATPSAGSAPGAADPSGTSPGAPPDPPSGSPLGLPQSLPLDRLPTAPPYAAVPPTPARPAPRPHARTAAADAAAPALRTVAPSLRTAEGRREVFCAVAFLALTAAGLAGRRRARTPR